MCIIMSYTITYYTITLYNELYDLIPEVWRPRRAPGTPAGAKVGPRLRRYCNYYYAYAPLTMISYVYIIISNLICITIDDIDNNHHTHAIIMDHISLLNARRGRRPPSRRGRSSSRSEGQMTKSSGKPNFNCLSLCPRL